MSVQALTWAAAQQVATAVTRAVFNALANYADERGCCGPLDQDAGRRDDVFNERRPQEHQGA